MSNRKAMKKLFLATRSYFERLEQDYNVHLARLANWKSIYFKLYVFWSFSNLLLVICCTNYIHPVWKSSVIISRSNSFLLLFARKDLGEIFHLPFIGNVFHIRIAPPSMPEMFNCQPDGKHSHACSIRGMRHALHCLFFCFFSTEAHSTIFR